MHLHTILLKCISNMNVLSQLSPYNVSRYVITQISHLVHSSYTHIFSWTLCFQAFVIFVLSKQETQFKQRKANFQIIYSALYNLYTLI
jgi:hypothetical protein